MPKFALKALVFLGVFFSSVISAELSFSSNITALTLHSNSLYIGSESGQVWRYDLDENSTSELVSLEKISTYYGDKQSAKIYSINLLNDEEMAILSEGNFGEKDFHFYKNKELKTLKQSDSGAKKIFLLDSNTLLVALLGSELKLYDLRDFTLKKSFKFSHSSLNDIALNEERNLAVVGFESGEVELFDIKNWQLVANFDKMHKDNIYQVDFKNNTAISCGTDRRIGLVSNLSNIGSQSFLQKDFLMYACALSKNAEFGAYTDNSKNELVIFNTKSRAELLSFDTKDLVNEFIIFTKEREFAISGFGTKILFGEF